MKAWSVEKVTWGKRGLIKAVRWRPTMVHQSLTGMEKTKDTPLYSHRYILIDTFYHIFYIFFLRE